MRSRVLSICLVAACTHPAPPRYPSAPSAPVAAPAPPTAQRPALVPTSDRDPLDPQRAPLTAAAIVGMWGIVTSSLRDVDDPIEWSGSAEVFHFFADGTYKFAKHTRFETGACHSIRNVGEVGSYTFDGRMLRVTPRSTTGEYSICARPKQRERPLSNMAPREYQLGMSRDGQLVFVGPSCMAYDASESRCFVGRWEARRQ